MGVSLALVFHVVSAIVMLALAGWGLRLSRDLTAVRVLIRTAAANRKLIVIDNPVRYVRRLCRIFGVTTTGRCSTQDSLVKIDAGLVASIFLRPGVSLVQFNESGKIEFHLIAGDAPELSQEALGSAFANSVTVSLVQADVENKI